MVAGAVYPVETPARPTEERVMPPCAWKPVCGSVCPCPTLAPLLLMLEKTCCA